jgi:hypothetical protein
MSTPFTIYKKGDAVIEINESSSRFDLDLYHFLRGDFLGPQHMEADEALFMASKIIYAVWCSYPDKADALVKALAEDIPNNQRYIT